MEVSKGGGGLSPILFCVYTDELLKRINESGIGCHIGHLYFAGLGYADDVGILSPSIEALHELLHICEKYADEFNVIFNAKKTMCMCISGRVQPPSRHVTLNGSPLRWTNKAKYLGNLVNSSLNDCEDIRMKTGIFISQVNKLNNKFSFVSSNVKGRLLQTYCTSWCGCQNWGLKTKLTSRADTMWNKAVKRTLRIPYTTHRHLYC